MQIGGHRGIQPASRLRVGARAIGCVATILIAIVGCTSVTDGAATVDTAIAPAYRESVSASVSASAATSSLQETRRQQSLTTQAVVRACRSFATTSKDAVDKVNDFVAAYNQGGDTTANEGPAIDTLNHSADLVLADSGGPLSDDLHHALNAYADAARDLAAAVRSHGDMGAFNQRVNQFNDTKSEAVKLCRASL
ncbi:MAG: hypothetical protein WCD33_27590 [Mycobacterium sp.]|uniref:hypothetical protein n=1 Tax=Mycobacterium sp. TaxID=1785 RepID=UPI003C72C675